MTDRTYVTRRRLVGFAAAGTGALVATSFDMADPAGAVTPLPWFDVRDYGALPDDAGDDTSAINAAISAATAATSGGIVLLPPGTFNISGPITIDATKKALLVGAGMWRTRFLCTSP